MINLKAALAAAVLGIGICVAPTVRAQGVPSEVGEWSGIQNWPDEAIHTIMLPTREVLFWGHGPNDRGYWLWDPETDPAVSISSAADPLRTNFCSGHAFRPDGTLLVSGGEIDDNIGLITATIYDPYTNFWTSVPDMSGGRWYPSSTTLANGDVLVSSASLGSRSTLTSPAANELPQVFEEVWTDWRDLTTDFPLPLYPRTFLAPNGSVFFALPQSGYLDTSGTGTWTDVASRNVGTRDNYGSAVMYEAGKVLWAGGGDPPTETCEIIDLNDPTPSWQFTGSMAQPRRQHNVTLLPDGKVLATVGTSAPGFNDATGAVLAAEMWDPGTGQ